MPDLHRDPDSPSASEPPAAALLRAAALAAGLLEDACAPGIGDPLRLEVVGALARDLKGELEVLAEILADEPRIGSMEGALLAADVANLAACAVPELPEERVPRAAAAAHLAAGAARSLGVLAGEARGAAWRGRLAAQQVDESLEGAG